MAQLGITAGKDGGHRMSPLNGTGRRLAIVNPSDPDHPQGIEVRSGSANTAGTLRQMNIDGNLGGSFGWSITSVLKQRLNPVLMDRIRASAKKYSGRLHYSVGGG